MLIFLIILTIYSTWLIYTVCPCNRNTLHIIISTFIMT
jgi:hypothetical protein